ncbi:hypothetical protein ONZ51_g11199 [Trametes cubensis]|uniref:Symplekin C-terminal domain-containing protein n=1 Tax=Trametes cubensis TaxID=1111947 RepID=A0AAD7X5L9_9APHY|nr:hypothetical protein ONZ51_g11199 [Trametes cubensis]
MRADTMAMTTQEPEHLRVTYNDVYNLIRENVKKIAEFKPDMLIAIAVSSPRVLCTFLKNPERKGNIPIHVIGLSLYESLPGMTAEQIGAEVIRTQWLGPESGKILLGRRALIVGRGGATADGLQAPPARELDSDERDELDLVPHQPGLADSGDSIHHTSPANMWMLLLVRMVTHVSDPAEDGDAGEEQEDPNGEEGAISRKSDIYDRQDRLRHALRDYIMADFPGRVQLATTWMNEVQRPDTKATQPVVAAYQTHTDGKDRTFSCFLLDLPHVPQDILTLLRESCVEPDRRQMGFAALREFVSQRPSLRPEAINMLLELTTHPDKITRDMVRDFALQLLCRLQSRPKTAQAEQSGDLQAEGSKTEEPKAEDAEDGQPPPEEIIQTPYLPEQLELPAIDSQILQHVELLFALSTKVPKFLDEIFAAYGGMDVSVQETIQQLITPLISIGICFSMTEIFRSEILAVVMNQLVDKPNLPTLFLRTVIQAATTYRSLVGFVSTTLLSRLITKKIWTNPPLWGGFIRLAKLIAPAIFGVLLQLPKDQLRELVNKQPSLKASLREHVMRKGTNKARVAGYLDIFGEDNSASAGKEQTLPASAPAPMPVNLPAAS